MKQLPLGVYDKENIEIKEGDILLDKNGFRYLVYYKKCSFVAKVLNFDSEVKAEFGLYFLIDTTKVKVIGNKYENEELLTEKELF